VSGASELVDAIADSIVALVAGETTGGVPPCRNFQAALPVIGRTVLGEVLSIESGIVIA